MKVAVLCKSDSTGGAAVTSRRLTEALNANGVQATLLVLETKSGSRYVEKARFPLLETWSFLKERLHIYFADGFSRTNLFKIDTGECGLPLWRHPVVKEADAVILNWVNQGMLSLKGVRKILAMGKKVVLTMHDMWNFTGVCHHAMECRRYLDECGCCPLLGRNATPEDLSHKIWRKKKALYTPSDITFVAVSSWLENCARNSSLLAYQEIKRIPNAFPTEDICPTRGLSPRDPYRILFVAARLDDSIKGLETLKKAFDILADKQPELARKLTLVLIGDVKTPGSIEGFAVNTKYKGRVDDPEMMRQAYGKASVVVSASHFENLPGTLIEGQAYGCVPVAFDRGGQRDIIDHLSTGFLAPWSSDVTSRASALADGIAWAIGRTDDIRQKMRESVIDKFSYNKIANEYIRLLG